MGAGKVVRQEQIQGIIDPWSPKDKPSKIVVDRTKPDSHSMCLTFQKQSENWATNKSMII